jgi:hypothetical protein
VAEAGIRVASAEPATLRTLRERISAHAG